MKMKAFSMLGVGKTGFVEIDKPVAGPMDAVIRPLALAPCTSDIHTVFDGAVGEFSAVLGHEAVGEIVEVGNEVKDFKVGDRVVVPGLTPDWNTLETQNGFPHHENAMLGGIKWTLQKPGVFCEFFHVNNADMNLALLPEGVSLESAVMVTDMVTTGFHGAELADIEFGHTVAVLGIGPVGLMAVVGAQLRGASRIIAVGGRQVCTDLAKEYGATEIINYRKENTVEKVMALTNGKGVDRVIIATDGSDNNIMADAVTIAKPGGVVANVTYFGKGDVLPIPRMAWGLGMGHKDIRGGVTPGGRLRMERLLELIRCNRFDPSKMITHRFNKFEDVEKALLMMKDKPQDMIKPVIILE